MKLPKASEIKWLEFKTHNCSYETFVKRGDQWYLITHDEGFITDYRGKVNEEKITEKIKEIPDWLAKNFRSKGWTAEWASEFTDRDDFFMVGEDGEPVSIAKVLDAIDSKSS